MAEEKGGGGGGGVPDAPTGAQYVGPYRLEKTLGKGQTGRTDRTGRTGRIG